MVDEKKKEEIDAKVIEVPTQMGIAIELADGTKISDIQLLVNIYNKLCRLERVLI